MSWKAWAQLRSVQSVGIDFSLRLACNGAVLLIFPESGDLTVHSLPHAVSFRGLPPRDRLL
jgi:hypothetical protein